MKKSIKISIITLLVVAVALAGALLGYYFGRKKAVDFSNLSYIALGDSITYAMDGVSGASHMQEPYCEVVKNILGLKAVTNYGISGSTICTTTNSADPPYEPMCERYVNMRDDADIVSVMGGTNDFGRYSTLGNIDDSQTSTFYGALNVLAQGLKEKYPHAFIFFMTPLKVTDAHGYVRDDGAEFDKYRQAIKDVCEKYDLPVLDTAELADTLQEFNAEDYHGDGLHPSQDFHKNVLAPVIADYLKNNYKAK